MVPANRIGYTELSLGQLKMMQEIITLAIFVPFSLFYMQQPLKLDYLWAGLCLLGAVYFYLSQLRERLHIIPLSHAVLKSASDSAQKLR